MKTSVKELSNSEVELEIEIPAEELDRFIEKACFNLGKDLEIRGFRKGKVPREIIEKQIGPEKILIEAANLAVDETYRKAVSENKIEAIFQPKIEIKKLAQGNPFVFSAKTDVLPGIKLPDYKKIASKIKRREIKVDDKEIETALKWLQKSRAKFTVKNQPAQRGDFIEIEYSSPQIGQEVYKDAFILEQGHFLPGFEEKIIGLKSGEEKENITLNKDGEEIILKVKVVSVQNVELSEIDDEFAKSLGKFENLGALKKNVEQGIVLEKEQIEKQRARQEILEKIGEKTKVEIPDTLIINEQKQTLENLKKMVSEKLKISFQDYLKKLGKTEEQVSDSFLLESQKKVRNYLILREIGKRELDPSPFEKGERVDAEEIKKYTTEAGKIEKIFQLLENL